MVSPSTLRTMKRITAPLVLALISILVSAPLFAQSGRIPTPAKHGIVTGAHYLASEIGVQVLKDGGNAVDAAVATAFALAVTHPSAGNVGGGGFLVSLGADGAATTFDFREKAPLAATMDMYLDESGEILETSNHEGPLAVGVPGTVAGLWLAHSKLGSRQWRELVQPAVALADNGIPFSWADQRFAEGLRAEEKPWYDAAKGVFLRDGKSPYEPGETWRQPELAATLARIRDAGRDGFYKGKTAALLAKFMRQQGGLITEEDLARYQAVEREPVRGTYRGYDVVSMPPPSSGGVAVIEMLNILEGFDLGEAGHNSARYIHLLTEAMRRAFADRAHFMGDPDFNSDLPVARLTSKEHARALRGRIDLLGASPSDPQAFDSIYLPAESEETTHLAIVDTTGNAVSLTYTLEESYGSRIVAEGLGFLLNNEMGDFNAIPGRTDDSGRIGTPPNLIAPEKRMLSSMTPTIVAKNGKPFLVIGSPGGRTIINTVLQVILNVIDHGMNVGEAVEAPRFHHQWLPDQTRFERHGFSADTLRLYGLLGHEISFRGSLGQANGILIDPESGLRHGAADSRGFNAKAVGY